MYWGCRKYGCRGCLNLFKGMFIMSSGLHHLGKIYFSDVDFSGAIMDGIINDNYYESEVLKVNYICNHLSLCLFACLFILDLYNKCVKKLREVAP